MGCCCPQRAPLLCMEPSLQSPRGNRWEHKAAHVRHQATTVTTHTHTGSAPCDTITRAHFPWIYRCSQSQISSPLSPLRHIPHQLQLLWIHPFFNVFRVILIKRKIQNITMYWYFSLLKNQVSLVRSIKKLIKRKAPSKLTPPPAINRSSIYCLYSIRYLIDLI